MRFARNIVGKLLRGRPSTVKVPYVWTCLHFIRLFWDQNFHVFSDVSLIFYSVKDAFELVRKWETKLVLAVKKFIKMRGWLLSIGSIVLTSLVIGNAFYQKGQFYPSVVYITKSNPSLAVSRDVDEHFVNAFHCVYAVVHRCYVDIKCRGNQVSPGSRPTTYHRLVRFQPLVNDKF